MKHRTHFLPMLTLLGMAVLAPTAPLAAQEQQPGVSPEAEGQQEMSQPTSPSTSESSGLTLTGEVIAMDQQALRVRTATGVENVVLTNRTDKAADVEIGDQVRVDFTRSSQGVMIATQIRKLTGAETGAANQPMSGSEVMGHAAEGSSAPAGSTAAESTAAGTPDTSGTMADTAGSTAGEPGMNEVPSTGLAPTTPTTTAPTTTAPATPPAQPLDQTGSQSGTAGSQTGTTGSATGTTGSTYGSATGSAGSTTGSATTGSTTESTGSTSGSTTGSTSSYNDESAAAGTETTTETAEPAMESESDSDTTGSLPDTGSGLPLAGLAGLLALGLALALRSLR
jgi:hypothetical protein